MRLSEFDMYPEQAFRSITGRSFGKLLSLEGGKGGGSAPAADANIGIAQREMSALAKEQWSKFTTDIYPEMLKQSQSQEARAQDQYALTKGITEKQQGYADKDRARYEQGAIPAMEKLRADADVYNTGVEQERLASQSAADVGTGFDAQRQQMEMRQRSYGIDPTSGAATGGANAMATQQALATAASATQTRQAAKDIGLQKQANVYNMYAGLPAQGNASTGIALGSSNQGFQGGQASLGNYGAVGSALNAGASTAMSGWNNVGNLGVGATNAATQAYSAQQQAGGAAAQGLGSAIGSGLTAYAMYSNPALAAAKAGGGTSDVRAKQDVLRIGSLDNGVALYSYEYIPELRDECGHGRQIGVLAHEVEHIPNAVSVRADGFKQVDYAKVMNHGI